MIEILEGKARLLVPNPEAYRVSHRTYSPSKTPVFFNPLMKDNRDLMIAVLTVLSNIPHRTVSFAESMGGIGVRTVRALVETNVKEAFYNDSHPLAVKLATENVERNGVLVRTKISSLDANVFQAIHSKSSNRVTYLDLDPFGSSAPYMFTAIGAVQHDGVLGVTSTDSAVLNGLHPSRSLARYGAWIEKTYMMRELGVRLLLGSLARMASSQDVGIVPLISYCESYYVRVYVKILRNKREAQLSISKLGFVYYDEESLSWTLARFGETARRYTGKPIGPIWTAPYCDKNFVRKIYDSSKGCLSPRVIKLLEVMLEELDSFGYIPLPLIAKKLKTNPVATATAVEKIREAGYEASPTIFGSDCIKTGIPPYEYLQFFKTNVLS